VGLGARSFLAISSANLPALFVLLVSSSSISKRSVSHVESRGVRCGCESRGCSGLESNEKGHRHQHGCLCLIDHLRLQRGIDRESLSAL
jgi:hypothetical protein